LLSQTRNIALYREHGTLGKAIRSERRRGNVTPRSQRRDAHAVNANKADKSAADAMRLAENTHRMSAIARQNRSATRAWTRPIASRSREWQPSRPGRRGRGIATEIPLTGEERTAIEWPFKAGKRLVRRPLLP
jgi:hypothetical protein